MTNNFIDGTLQHLFGVNVKLEISEFNIRSLPGGMYAAMFVAEYTIRMSPDPPMTQMGMHTLIGRPVNSMLPISPGATIPNRP
jgi:hypothetical protein